MTRTAPERLEQITLMLAEMSGGEAGSRQSVAALAQRLEVSEVEIMENLDILSHASDNPRNGAFDGIELGIDSRGVTAKSRGPFMRPLNLNALEALALGISLLTEPGRVKAMAKLEGIDSEVSRAIDIGAASGADVDSIVARLAHARQLKRVVEIGYIGEDDTAEGVRRIDPHELVEHRGITYVVAWCEQANDRRVFRAERITRADVLEDEFELRPELLDTTSPSDLDNRSDGGDIVTVRFTARIAPWIRERHPHASDGPDGSVLVQYRVWNAHWLVSQVLQYGAEAEVLEPAVYREAVKRACWLDS